MLKVNLNNFKENLNLQQQIKSYLGGYDLQWSFQQSELERLPKSEPFVLVCNHLAEGLDEVLLAGLLAEQTSSFQLFGKSKDLPVFLDPYIVQKVPDEWLVKGVPAQGVEAFWSLLLQSEHPLPQGIGVVLDFPGGRWGQGRQLQQLDQLLQSLRQLGRPICPVRLHWPENLPLKRKLSGGLFQRMQQKTIEVETRIANPISTEELERVPEPDRFRKFLQSKIFALGTSLEVKPFFSLPFLARKEQAEPIADAVDSLLIEQEIQALHYSNLLVTQGDYQVLIAAATEIPNTLQEIGRLRELTFRAVGEGSGKSRDLDEFDLYYHQLIIWDHRNKCIVGGYRLGKGEEIFAKFGVEGFYIHSLFRIQRGFFPIMRRSVELGRSYIVPDYQRKRLPLFLLWKGILHFLLANAQYRYLYGPVSISKYYSNISKSLIIAFIKKYYFNAKLAAFLQPRKPFKVKLDHVDLEVLMEGLGKEMKQLDNFIEDIEPAHFRMPVLMRQYIKLNARFISFNVDPNFSDVLDGFILLDLNEVPFSMIEALKKEAD